MPLVVSGIMLNFKSLSAVYGASPTTVSLPDITQIMHPRDANEIHLYGDSNQYMRIVNAVEIKREITIKGNCVNAMASLPINTPITLTWLEGDAVNKYLTAGGGYTYTAVNCILHKNPYDSNNNKHVEGGLTFTLYMDTSDTDPISKVLL